MLWACSSAFDFHKTLKDSFCINWKDQCENVNLPVQDVRNGPNIKKDSTDKRHIHFSITKIGLRHKYIEVTLIKETEFLRSIINSVTLTVALPKKKNRCNLLIVMPPEHDYELNKLTG